MPSWIDNALDLHAQAIAVRGRRAEILASNLANADTPGYKARDINFRDVLAQARGGSTLHTTSERHFTSASSGLGGGEIVYRTPNQASLDGNTVETQVEKAQFGENAVRYQASVNFLNGSIKGLMLALRGE
ncbi:flagellar basal body rod protein FlgB [Porticoccus sp. W117]|uniref:flagellar basal body rod protein FlgB n=1 Tax=Porticoccus sp. W117 TaxID=3054777 RepID=UPI0025922D37|nr:flagellar basal body rod protein FlgB [Porticoccus sp. W117]MDM3871025.1 flagellar basal body rod protein FlgB [Porticoccus sp. W117]